MNHRPPLGAPAVWQAVMAAAGGHCQCTGGLCGSQHSDTGRRCLNSSAHGRLLIAPADLTLTTVAAAAVPAEELRAWCAGCHAKARARQLASLRELERQTADEPLSLF
ncbi:hypothetical protein AB0911_30495 [Streptomyces nigra]|uniref:hypothetical protein n=1 Tax=Streptomyces nigra TaxID=1827580 RepID=UPI003455F34A